MPKNDDEKYQTLKTENIPSHEKAMESMPTGPPPWRVAPSGTGYGIQSMLSRSRVFLKSLLRRQETRQLPKAQAVPPAKSSAFSGPKKHPPVLQSSKGQEVMSSPPLSSLARYDQEQLNRAYSLSLADQELGRLQHPPSRGFGRQKSSRSGPVCGIDRSQLPNRAMPSPKKDIRPGPYRMVDVPGDGDCFFHSIIGIFRHNGLLEQLKTCMLRDAQVLAWWKGDIDAELFRTALAYGIIHKGLGNTYLSRVFRHRSEGEESYRLQTNAEDAADFPFKNKDNTTDYTRPVINYNKLIFPSFARAQTMQYNDFKNYVANRIAGGQLFVDAFESSVVAEYLNSCHFMVVNQYKVDFVPNGSQRDNTFTFYNSIGPHAPNNKTMYIAQQAHAPHYNYIITPFAL